MPEREATVYPKDALAGRDGLEVLDLHAGVVPGAGRPRDGRRA